MENKQLETAKLQLALMVKDCNHTHYSEFVMHLEGGKMPKDESYYIPVIIYYDGTATEDFVKWCSAGSSRRVTLQTTLRDKCNAFTRSRVNREGLVIHGSDVKEIPKTPKEVQLELIAELRLLKTKSPDMFKAAMDAIKTK